MELGDEATTVGGMNRMEVIDWDGKTITLEGLDMSMSLAKIREAVSRGLVSAAGEEMVKSRLENVAVYVYNHQKMTPQFRHKVGDGEQSLAYYVHALHEVTPAVSKPLSLAHWAALYYAVHAEIRMMYGELRHCYGENFDNKILHNSGPDATGGECSRPISVVGLAAILEQLWLTLTDPRIVAALDRAVQVKNSQDNMAQSGPNRSCDDGTGLNERSETTEHARDGEQGMMDVDTMTPEDLINEVGQDQSLPKHTLGALAEDIAQMQSVPSGSTDLSTLQTRNVGGTGYQYGTELVRTRSRANTESELAYVPPPPPPKTPFRLHKDAYPLGFYGEGSGQRYPDFRDVQTAQMVVPPVYGGSSHADDSQVPVRKPVPVLSSSPPSSPLPTLPDSSPSASVRPVSEEAKGLRTSKSRPRLLTSATMPGRLFSRKKSFSNIAVASEPEPPLPQSPLPEPDFISPKPATKQRYVSAGGSAKVADRPEIDGPKFANPPSGTTIPKQELLDKLFNDPEYVKATFGEGAVKISQDLAKEDLERGSQESSARNSAGSLIKHEKRDRTGSSSSSFGEKMKRVFSRKSSDCE